MYLIKGHIIRLLYLCPFHFFFTVLILLNILYSCLLSGKKKYKIQVKRIILDVNERPNDEIFSSSQQRFFVTTITIFIYVKFTFYHIGWSADS